MFDSNLTPGDIARLTDEELLTLVKMSSMAEYELSRRLRSGNVTPVASSGPFPQLSDRIVPAEEDLALGEVSEVTKQEKDHYKALAISILGQYENLNENGWTALLEEIDSGESSKFEFTIPDGGNYTLVITDHYLGNKSMPPYLVFQLLEVSRSASFLHTGVRDDDGVIKWDDLSEVAVDKWDDPSDVDI